MEHRSMIVASPTRGRRLALAQAFPRSPNLSPPPKPRLHSSHRSSRGTGSRPARFGKRRTAPRRRSRRLKSRRARKGPPRARALAGCRIAGSWSKSRPTRVDELGFGKGRAGRCRSAAQHKDRGASSAPRSLTFYETRVRMGGGLIELCFPMLSPPPRNPASKRRARRGSRIGGLPLWRRKSR